MKFGAEILNGDVRFRLWAPKIREVFVVLNGGPPLSMIRTPQGWHEIVCPDCPGGTRYKFQLERGGLEVPDPASRYQPLDVHGPSIGTRGWTETGGAGPGKSACSTNCTSEHSRRKERFLAP
jgi:1,4-alpha-glucan branching enzyme